VWQGITKPTTNVREQIISLKGEEAAKGSSLRKCCNARTHQSLKGTETKNPENRNQLTGNVRPAAAYVQRQNPQCARQAKEGTVQIRAKRAAHAGHSRKNRLNSTLENENETERSRPEDRRRNRARPHRTACRKRVQPSFASRRTVPAANSAGSVVHVPEITVDRTVVAVAASAVTEV